jgi:hypothetical protein
MSPEEKIEILEYELIKLTREVSDCVPKGFDTDFLVNNSIKGLKGIKK